MELIVGKNAGMCNGVKYAIEKAKEILSENDKVYCIGEIVHNRQVVDELENLGMITVSDISEVPNDSNVIFRTHGVSKETYERAFRKGLHVFDLTCVNVAKIHEGIEKEKKRSFIIIIGNPNHAEVIGTKGFAGENSYIIDDEDEILDAYMEYEKSNKDYVYVVAQTTFSSKKFDILADEIRDNFAEATVLIDKTICRATDIRQAETQEIASQVSSMIIIGGKNSSNTQKLVKIAEKECGKVYFIETSKDLKRTNFGKKEKIGIMAGASTPQNEIDKVVEFFK